MRYLVRFHQKGVLASRERNRLAPIPPSFRTLPASRGPLHEHNESGLRQNLSKRQRHLTQLQEIQTLACPDPGTSIKEPNPADQLAPANPIEPSVTCPTGSVAPRRQFQTPSWIFRGVPMATRRAVEETSTGVVPAPEPGCPCVPFAD